jgi:hypothetical protein
MSVAVTALVVASLAAIASVGAALLGIRAQRHAGVVVAERAATERAQALLDRYQEHLVRSAFDLQSRLYNILERGLVTTAATNHDYIEKSPVWLLGQYFGWVEILGREAQFLALPTADDRANVQRLLGRIARACSSDSLGGGAELQIQRSEQRALGEVMVIEGRDAAGGPRSDCLGYAAFCKALDDPASPVHRWYFPLLPEVWPAGGTPNVRLVHLQHALIDLVDAIDPDEVHFPDYRTKVRRRDLCAGADSRPFPGRAGI